MMLKSALVLVLAATLTGCAYDTYGNRTGRARKRLSNHQITNSRSHHIQKVCRATHSR